MTPADPDSPYKFLDPYGFDDEDLFFGRDEEIKVLVADVVVSRLVVLFAPTGTGKTSLARILAKALNCAQGPTTTPDGTCHSCVAIASGTSLDVIEMDAASQRGIDYIREIRERGVLQPVEGRTPYSRGVGAGASDVVDIHDMDATPWISTMPREAAGA